MKLFRSIFVLLLLLSTSFAQVQTSSEKHLRKHVEYLASEKLEGRRTGEKGAQDAVSYIAKEFEKYKLKGVEATHGFLRTQPFPYVAGVTLGEGNTLRIVANDESVEVGSNWMPLGYSMNGDVPPSEIWFAGFGTSFAGMDLKDKIALIFDSVPDSGNPHSPFAGISIHRKASMAKDAGARAIILIAEDRNFKNDRLSRLVYDRTLGETTIPVIGVTRELGSRLFGRGDVADLDRTEKAMAAQEQVMLAPSPQISASIKVSLKKNTVVAENVIGILPGNDPLLKNEAIIIGAHYDHLGRGGSGSLAANSADIHHGADDNASGTSAVIELARQFAKEKKNKRTLIFIAFGGEEEGLLGSKYYVNNPVWPLDKTVAMINLDMVGRLNENKLTVGGVGTAGEWRALVESKNVGDVKLVGASAAAMPAPLATTQTFQ
ncbi:MAG TPA: M28 family peptidase, partial [Pyrinomonadaceae bacterium]|nr:M28 family peptidase [Pyrinomonadaceae bacterium]